MPAVKENDHVTVVYEGILQNGEIFESSADSGPLDFQLGTNAVMPAFEEAVLDMEVGNTKTVTVKAVDGYGEKKTELIIKVPKKSVGQDVDVKPGMVLGIDVEKEGKQHKVPALVTEVKGDELTVDFNHPLAGQLLTYKITLNSINQPAPAADTPDNSCSTGGCGSCS